VRARAVLRRDCHTRPHRPTRNQRVVGSWGCTNIAPAGEPRLVAAGEPRLVAAGEPRLIAAGEPLLRAAAEAPLRVLLLQLLVACQPAQEFSSSDGSVSIVAGAHQQALIHPAKRFISRRCERVAAKVLSHVGGNDCVPSTSIRSLLHRTWGKQTWGMTWGKNTHYPFRTPRVLHTTVGK
jgi:hypothetical protein